jgi:hypothetical protein
MRIACCQIPPYVGDPSASVAEAGEAISAAAADGALVAGPVNGRGVATIAADCDLNRARDKRSGHRNDVFADRRPDCYSAALVGDEPLR